MKSRLKIYIALHILLMRYTISGIVSKFAAREDFLSLPFILLYGVEILLLAFYAIGWQQFVKRMPLSLVYANRAVTVVWGCIWSVVIFNDYLTPGKIGGAILVLIGVALFGYADGKENEKEEMLSQNADDEQENYK